MEDFSHSIKMSQDEEVECKSRGAKSKVVQWTTPPVGRRGRKGLSGRTEVTKKRRKCMKDGSGRKVKPPNGYGQYPVIIKDGGEQYVPCGGGGHAGTVVSSARYTV